MEHESGHDCHGRDINQILDLPTKISVHCRAQSEIINLPDDINSICNLYALDNNDDDEELFSMLDDLEKCNSSFEELSQLLEDEPLEPLSTKATIAPPPHSQDESLALSCGERPRLRPKQRHKHSQSIDESFSFSSELLTLSMKGLSAIEKRKAMSVEKLVNIALVDPKKAKRIWANRQSAIKSKERRMQYMAELEQRVQALQMEATILSTQISLVQSDTIELMGENTQLKLQLQFVEQHIYFQDALNDAVVKEIERLRITMLQMSSCVGATTNLEEPPYEELQHLYYHNQALQPLFTEKELHILSQDQLTSQEHQTRLHKTVYM
ncbi:probable transcription factor PosF21 [Typha latifolia]|uniref:probable transcription factor PosF21 n=1 Tax=Typha latifolia TaxID=4733 RepID=UPI003C2DE6EC